MYVSVRTTALATIALVAVCSSTVAASWTPNAGVYRQAFHRRDQGNTTPPIAVAPLASPSLVTTTNSQQSVSENTAGNFCEKFSELKQTNEEKYYQRIFCSQQELESSQSPEGVPGGEEAAANAPSTVTITQSELLNSTQLSCVEEFEAYHAKERFRNAICIIAP
ncbi:hypothetical protein H4R34_001777 [Dimargaris verticillata]|uniref:Secreted protein n=1 Tax=Dimargaris verticillata TaxID=2761393 RepID=A0A9W8B981_9FUNG|nr:hypothetical protein H4R34_001777 [Dimargaris verticillata]